MTHDPAGELTRLIQIRNLPRDAVEIEATEAERTHLARRFGINAVRALRATVTLEPVGDAVRAAGHLAASIEQNCAVSGEPFHKDVDEPVELLFVAARDEAPPRFDEEIELDAGQLDEIPFDGDSFDLGEAVAQTLGLAIDPYAEGPDADAARAEAGIVADDAPTGSLAAALSALKLR